MHTFVALTTIILYCCSFAVLLKQITSKTEKLKTPFLVLLVLTILAHIFSLNYSVFADGLIHLGFFKVSSLIFCAISIIALISVLRKMPIENLLLILFPMAALSIAVGEWIPSPTTKLIDDNGLITHIILSILAYSIITLASLQAILLAAQEHQLKKHPFTGLLRYWPPLQTMEVLLFEMIWLGFILLSLAIASGFIFLDDMFVQHLAHKTALSIIAWAIFAILLYGRHAKGWRGATATKWTIGGFIALMLAYFGTKFVLELILHRL